MNVCRYYLAVGYFKGIVMNDSWKWDTLHDDTVFNIGLFGDEVKVCVSETKKITLKWDYLMQTVLYLIAEGPT